MSTIFEDVISLGIDHSNHETDLYIPVNRKTTDLIKKYYATSIGGTWFPEALIQCRNHWQWLWITGGRKDSYIEAYKWKHSCACCEYTSNIEEYTVFYDCNKCPLTGFAWDSLGEVLCSFCDRSEANSVYDEWKDSENMSCKKKWAKAMVDACNRAIESYIINE